jgi:serine/threonine-protein kinase RsbW
MLENSQAKAMQQNDETVQLWIPSRLGYEKVAMAAAGSIAKSMGFHTERVEDLETAVSEACINAIEHGNKNVVEDKVLLLIKSNGERLEVNVKDQGKLMESPRLNTPSIEDKLKPGAEKRGWGMFLIKSLVDELDMNVQPGNGLQLKMVIYLQKRG